MGLLEQEYLIKIRAELIVEIHWSLIDRLNASFARWVSKQTFVLALARKRSTTWSVVWRSSQIAQSGVPDGEPIIRQAAYQLERIRSMSSTTSNCPGSQAPRGNSAKPVAHKNCFDRTNQMGASP